MIYAYEAKDQTGQTISGSLEAESERVAATRVRDMGFFPMRLRPAAGMGSSAGAAVVETPILHQTPYTTVKQVFPLKEMLLRALVYPLYTGVGLRDLAVFYRQLSAMLNAGVAIRRTLDTVSGQTSSLLLRQITRKMRDHINAGGQLSESMALYPYVFTDMHREFVATAEKTGHLPEILTRLAEYCEQEYNMRMMIKRETFQTKLTLVAALFIPGIPMLFLKGPHAYFQSLTTTFTIALSLFGGWIASRLFGQTRAGSLLQDTVKSYIPYFGTTVRMLAIAKFSRAFSALYGAGVLIPTALEVSARVSGNAYLTSLMDRASESIKAGESLTSAMTRVGVFPPMLISMVSTGEETGSLDAMLTKVADFYEGEAQARLHKSAIALTTLFFLAVAAYVGYEVVSFYMGYANEIQSFTNDANGN